MEAFHMRIFLLVTLISFVLKSAEPPNRGGGTDRPVTSREVEQLRQDILDDTRSSVEGIFEYHTETGDLNNRLDFWRAGGAVNYRAQPGLVLYLRGTQTNYMGDADYLREHGTNLTAGVRKSISDDATVKFEAGATRFSTASTTLNALGSFEVNSAGGTSLAVTGSRSNVEETLLSSTGVRPTVGPFAGQLVGRVVDNRFVAAVRHRVLPKLDVFGEGGAGVRTGSNVESNTYRLAGGGVGYNIVSEPDDRPLSLLRASYSLDYFGFDKNQFGFGGASFVDRRGRTLPETLIGSDGLSTIGLGGYFSPQRYISNLGRVEVRGRYNRALDYRLTGFAGTQSYTGSQLRAATGLSASLGFRLNDRFSLPVTYLWDNVGPFNQQSVIFRLVARL
jgi:cellulose synthase operon protein C